MLSHDDVYEPHNNHLGDHWTSYSLMTALGGRYGKRFKLSCRNPIGVYTHRLQEIAELFTEQPYPAELVDSPPTAKVDPWLNWAFPALMVNSEYRWSMDTANMSPYVCFQFDGVSNPSNNPSKPMIYEIKEYFRNLGYTTVRLGAHTTIKRAAQELSTCALFVGANSGFSHIAHSVGCPVYLYEDTDPTFTTHKLKQVEVFRSVPELIMKSEHWLWFLRT